MGEAAVGEAALLGERDHLLDIGTKLLRLGRRGGDLLMLDEGRGRVADQGSAMAGGTLQLTAADAMTHGISFTFVPEPFKVIRARRGNGGPPKPHNSKAESYAPPCRGGLSSNDQHSQSIGRSTILTHPPLTEHPTDGQHRG